MRTTRAFTLIEVVISIFILMLILLLAVPSWNGLSADRRLRRSLDGFNGLVHQAQEHSLKEHRAYLIVFGDKSVEVRPEALTKEDDPKPVAEFPVAKNEMLRLVFTAALAKNPPAEWIFWPSGTCEPVTVEFSGRDGHWIANYPSLTVRPTLTTYAAR